MSLVAEKSPIVSSKTRHIVDTDMDEKSPDISLKNIQLFHAYSC